MASPMQQNFNRKYAYGYGGATGYFKLLNKVHRELEKRIQREKDIEGAQTLQTFLQDIKTTARKLNEQTEEFKRNKNSVPMMDRLILAQNDLSEWYETLIDNIAETQTNMRGNTNGLGTLGKNTLFRRQHATSHIQNVDDIVEEEMIALLRTLQAMNGDKVYSVDSLAAGQSKAHVDNLKGTDSVTKDLVGFFSDTFKEWTKESTGHKFAVATNQIQEEKSGKIDLNKATFSVNGKLTLKSDFLTKVISLLNDATFTIKNYKNSEEAKAWGNRLKLGETNLLKAIVAELNIAFPNRNDQKDIFYRGAQILVKTNKPPSATPETVGIHFTHMRFAYELAGLGLLDEQNNPLFAKYLIYNVPNSNEIYVKDTASLILDQFESKYSNVFGTLYLQKSAARGE